MISLQKYNYNANDPLVGNTDIDGQAIAKGDVAMWFMGDWAWNYIKDSASADDEFGLMPLSAGPERKTML